MEEDPPDLPLTGMSTFINSQELLIAKFIIPGISHENSQVDIIEAGEKGPKESQRLLTH